MIRITIISKTRVDDGSKRNVMNVGSTKTVKNNLREIVDVRILSRGWCQKSALLLCKLALCCQLSMTTCFFWQIDNENRGLICYIQDLVVKILRNQCFTIRLCTDSNVVKGSDTGFTSVNGCLLINPEMRHSVRDGTADDIK